MKKSYVLQQPSLKTLFYSSWIGTFNVQFQKISILFLQRMIGNSEGAGGGGGLKSQNRKV